MRKLLFLVLFVQLVSCSPDEEKEFPFYVAENGVTIKARDWVAVGTTAPINAQGVAYIKNLKGAPEWDKVNYIAVDLAWLKLVLNTYSDLSTLVTTKVEITNEASAKGLFLRTEIKGMENWDVSNWTSMNGL